jgi:hypothetical protein
LSGGVASSASRLRPEFTWMLQRVRSAVPIAGHPRPAPRQAVATQQTAGPPLRGEPPVRRMPCADRGSAPLAPQQGSEVGSANLQF